MPASSTTSDVQKLVDQYPEATRKLIAAARKTLKSAFPKVAETADLKRRLLCYAYGPGYKGVVATLILSKQGVKIGVPYGSTLPDPQGLLAGAGKVHRHIAVASPAELERPAVTRLLAAGFAAWKERAEGA